MGLFKKVFNTVEKIITAPQHIHAQITKKIGETLEKSNVEIIYKAGWALQDVADKMEPECYKKENTTTSVIIDISTYCKEYYNEASTKTNLKLKEQIVISKNAINDVKKDLQIYVPSDEFNRIKNIVPDNLFENVSKKANDTIASRISLSNIEFKELLSIISDSERKTQCKKYIAKTMEEVLETATKDVIKEKNVVINNMLSVVDDYLSQIENELKLKQKEQEELFAEKENIEMLSHKFSDKVIDIAYLSCVLRETEIFE